MPLPSSGKNPGSLGDHISTLELISHPQSTIETRILPQEDNLNTKTSTNLLNKDGTLEIFQHLPNTTTTPLFLGPALPSLTLTSGKDTIEDTRVDNSINDLQKDLEHVPNTLFYQEAVQPNTGSTEPLVYDKATEVLPIQGDLGEPSLSNPTIEKDDHPPART